MSGIRGALACLLAAVVATAASVTTAGAADVSSAPTAAGSPHAAAGRQELQTIALSTATAGGFGSLPSMSPPRDGATFGSAVPVVYSDQYDVQPFRLAAVTWTGAAPVAAWVRVRTGGTWSSWYELGAGDDHQPDPDAAEAADARNGTDPLLVPESNGIQVRVDSTVRPGARSLRDLRLDLVDPAADPGMATGLAAGETAADTVVTPRGVRRPVIQSRASWGADESLRSDPPDYGQVNGAFVHHTVSATAYDRSDVPAMIRSIYLYHVRSRGWNDVGYNYIVDRFGRIWEGRYGGVDRAVVGAHTAGYNDDAFAASALGTYTDTPPSAAMLAAYQNLFAWKFRIHGVDPRYPVNYDGEAWQPIAGHRDAAPTACPGDALFARLNVIRRGVTTSMGYSPSRDLDSDLRPDLLATRPDGSLWAADFGPGAAVQGLGVIAGGWDSMASILAPGDWNTDRDDDLIGRRRSDGTLWLFPGDGARRLGDAVRIGQGWGAMSLVTAPGDWNRDGRPDIVARRTTDGTLWLYPGDGAAGFRTPVRIGTSWQRFTALVGPGDWDGDGIEDLVARRDDGTLWLFPGVGNSRIGTARQIGTAWNGYQLAGAGDANGDGYADLVARTTSATLVLYPGNGSGGFGPRVQLGSGWGGYNRLI